MRIIVAGGINIDTIGTTTKTPQHYVSNPCSIKYSFGGVAFNVASTVAKLGKNALLLGAVGSDDAGKEILKKTNDRDVNDNLIDIIAGETTSNYFAFNDPHGKLFAAFSSMTIMSQIIPNRYEARLNKLQNIDGLIVDANLNPIMINHLVNWAQKRSIPSFAIGVSAEKMKNFAGIIHKVDYLLINFFEACALSHERSSNINPKNLLMKIKNLGAKNCLVTLQEKGVATIKDNELLHFHPPKIISCPSDNGAGDAFCAAFIVDYLAHNSFSNSIAAGFIASENVLTKKY